MTKPEYKHAITYFGEEYRLTISPGVECGAFRKRKGRTWEAFGSFGSLFLNESDFPTEDKALEHAEKWLMGLLEQSVKDLREAVVKRA